MEQTPKEKAEELVLKYIPLTHSTAPKHDAIEIVNNAKECALITAYQILKLSGLPQFQIVFWREVENELKNKIINH